MVPPTFTAAAVRTRKRQSELRELPVPPIVGDAALLRIEATDVFGADVGFYKKELSRGVLGHENAGTVVRIGAIAAERWGVQDGDSLALEEYQGVLGHSYQPVECDISAISSGKHPIDLLCSLEGGLHDVDRAILGTAGEIDGPVIHAAAMPA